MQPTKNACKLHTKTFYHRRRNAKHLIEKQEQDEKENPYAWQYTDDNECETKILTEWKNFLKIQSWKLKKVENKKLKEEKSLQSWQYTLFFEDNPHPSAHQR